MINIGLMPYSLGGGVTETESSAQAIFDQLLPHLEQRGIEYGVLEAITPNGLPRVSNSRIKNYAALIGMNRSLKSSLVSSISKEDQILLTLGGDRGSILSSAFATKELYPQAAIVYLSGFGDSFMPGTSSSEWLNNSIVPSLLGRAAAKDLPTKGYRDFEMMIIGPQYLERVELEYIKGQNIKYFGVNQILVGGFKPLIQAIRQTLGHKPVHVFFSMDTMNFQDFPGISQPNQGGFSYREIKLIFSELAKKQIRGISFADQAPEFDHEERTLTLATELILDLVG